MRLLSRYLIPGLLGGWLTLLLSGACNDAVAPLVVETASIQAQVREAGGGRREGGRVARDIRTSTELADRWVRWGS